jgi:hypothetical protein
VKIEIPKTTFMGKPIAGAYERVLAEERKRSANPIPGQSTEEARGENGMTVELHMLPVPAGDCSLIVDRSTGKPYTVLIDAGLATNEVVAYLQRIGVYHLDLVILSHPDLDHLQGLLQLVENSLISISRLWCFDLAFLREFVTTGKIPPPSASTHKVSYWLLLRTLAGQDRILKTALARGCDAYQVSEGYAMNLGNLHIEVLYPWDGFYDALRNPAQIKKLLAKKWPPDWMPPAWARGRDQCEASPNAQRVRRSEEEGLLDRLLERVELSEREMETRPLAGLEGQENGPHDLELSEDQMAKDEFPISMLGTLYNNLSVVVKVEVLGGISPPTMLFPGDLTDWTYLFARHFNDLSAHIFKYPHHGSVGPGIRRKFIEQHWFRSHRFCPCGPWCHPECCDYHHELWLQVEEGVLHSKNMAGIFTQFIRPKHTLMFPYPRHGLPRPELFQANLGVIHANRKDLTPDRLRRQDNLPAAHVLQIGAESHQIQVASERDDDRAS